MALRLFLSLGLLRFSMDTTPHTSPLRFSFWDTGFRFFDSFLRGKSGVDVGICCADDGRPPAWKEDWFGAFGVKAV